MAPTRNTNTFRNVMSSDSLTSAEEPAIKLEDGVEQAPAIKTEDDSRQEPVHFKDEEKPNIVLDAIKWPVVTHKRIALSTISPSPTLLDLIRHALCIYLDDAWEKEEDEGGVYYRVKLDRMDDFDRLIEQAVKEIKPLVCEALGLDPQVAINYIAHVFRVPPDVSLTAKDYYFLVIPLNKDVTPGLRVAINRRGHRPTQDDEIIWPPMQDECSVFLIDRQARIKALNDTIIFLSIIYVWEDANMNAGSSYP